MARDRIEIKTPDQLRAMRRAGLVVARALDAVRAAVRVGVTTAELDAVAAEVIASARATPSFLGYQGFPAVTCISVNDQVVHGIPGDQRLVDGDLVSIDCGAIVDGFHGDAALTVGVGSVRPEHLALSEATRRAMWRGIAAARLGGRVHEISAAVETSVRDSGPYGIVADYTGHGIGSAMHQAPDVPNLASSRIRRALSPSIVPGLALAIEPMVTLGDPESVETDDGWTVVTVDGGWAAHWEHTMTVTEHGTWVLTADDGGEAELAGLGVPFGPLFD